MSKSEIIILLECTFYYGPRPNEGYTGRSRQKGPSLWNQRRSRPPDGAQTGKRLVSRSRRRVEPRLPVVSARIDRTVLVAVSAPHNGSAYRASPLLATRFVRKLMNYSPSQQNNEEPRDRQSRGSILFSSINPLNGNTND